MAAVLKAKLVCQGRQHSLEPFVGKLDDPVAALADEMLMVGLGHSGLVAPEALTKFMGAHQSAFEEQVESAIDGRGSDPFALALELAADSLHRKVIFRQEDDLGYQVSLAGDRLMMLSEMSAKAVEKSRSLNLVQACHRRGHLQE